MRRRRRCCCEWPTWRRCWNCRGNRCICPTYCPGDPLYNRFSDIVITIFIVDHLWTIDEAIRDTYTKSDSCGKLACKMQRVFQPQADPTTRRQTGSRCHQWMMKFSTVKEIEFTVLTSNWIYLTVIFWFDNSVLLPHLLWTHIGEQRKNWGMKSITPAAPCMKCLHLNLFTLQPLHIQFTSLYSFTFISTPKVTDDAGEQDAAAELGGLDTRIWDHFGAFLTLDEAEEDT